MCHLLYSSKLVSESYRAIYSLVSLSFFFLVTGLEAGPINIMLQPRATLLQESYLIIS